VTANTTIQLNVPDHLRGRVMSVYTTVFSGSVPAGGLLMGAIASGWGVPISLLIGGVLSVAGGAGAWLWLRRIHPEPRRVQRSALASADIGAIDPEGRSAGVIGRARPR
jgi:MFS family permease